MPQAVNSHHRKPRMRWEIRLGIALLFFVAAVLLTVWCITRLNHYPDGAQHTWYALATAAACLAVVGSGVHAILVTLEKR
jgi:hypothetical protein